MVYKRKEKAAKNLSKFKEVLEQLGHALVVYKNIGEIQALEQSAQEISSNHRYPIGGGIEESHHGYTCSHCTQRFNINIFIIAVLNKSETVLGCKSK